MSPSPALLLEPAGRVDGLGQQFITILDQLRENQANGIDGAVAMAYQQVSAGIRVQVDARITDGTDFIDDR